MAKKGEKTSKNAFLQKKKSKKRKNEYFLKYPEKNRNCRSEGRWHPAVPGSAGYPNTRGFAVPDPGPGKPLLKYFIKRERKTWRSGDGFCSPGSEMGVIR